MNFPVRELKRAILAAAITAIALMVWFLSTPSAVGALPDVVADYKTKCASCHGLDGSGNTVMGKKLEVKDLRSAEAQKLTDAQMTTIIAKGKGKMPGNEKNFSAERIKQLVAYVRELGKKK
jgi:cytochrome c6